jgi:hypothetical protein
MSKTIEEVGLIVGGAALALLPGGGLLAIEGESHTLTWLFGVGLSAALTGVGLALRSTPKTLGTSSSISFQSGDAFRRVIYGQFQTPGVLTYQSYPPSQNLQTTNQYLHLVYTLAEHEISSFDAVVINGTVYNFGASTAHGDLVWETASGNSLWHVDPQGGTPLDFYGQHMFFEFDFGRNNNAQPFPALAAADSTWTSACIQQGCAKVHVILRYDSGISALFPSGQIPNIQFLVTGKKLIDPRIVTAWQPTTGYNKYQYIVDNHQVVWVNQTGAGTSGATRPNFEASDGSGVTLTDGGITWRSSGFNMATIAGGTDTFPQGHLVKNRLVNDAYNVNVGYAQYGIIEAPLGYLQQATVNGATGSGAEPAFSTTLGGTTTDGSQTWICLGRSWHAINPSNPALVIYDYLQDTSAGMSAAPASIDVASVIAAANVCEEQVVVIVNPDSTSVYENLYNCDGMFDHSSERGKVLGQLAASMAGYVIPPGDLWHVQAGGYVTPTLAITDADFRETIKGDFRLSRRDAANSIRGTYIPRYLPSNAPAALSLNQVPPVWTATNYPPWQSAAYISEDGGQVIWQDVNFDFVTSLWQAQRLAKIELMRKRFQQTFTLPCTLAAFQLEAGDTFYLTHSRWGIVSQVCEVVQASLVAAKSAGSGSGQEDAPAIAVDLIVRQTDPSVYEFTAPTSSSNYGDYSPYGVTGVLAGPH